MTKRLSRYLALLILLAATGCALLPAERSQTQSDIQRGPTPTPIPTPIVATKPTYEVKRGSVIDSVQFSGRVAPIVEEELFFSITGRVRSVYFDDNEMVVAGDVIADLEIDDLERDLTSAELELERTQKQLEEAEVTHDDALTRASLSLELAQAQLTEATKNDTYTLNRAAINMAMKRLELAKLENQDLESRQILAKADLEEAINDLKPAQLAYDKIAYGDDEGVSGQAIALQKATLNYERAQASYNITLRDIQNHATDVALLTQEIALAELEFEQFQETGKNFALENAVAMAKLDVEILERGIDISFRHAVERALLNVEKLEKAISDAQIKAPFDGKLLSVRVYEGREVQAYNAVVILADVSQMEVSADPSTETLKELGEGMPVTITFASRPGVEIGGTISRLPYPYGGGGRVEDVGEGQTPDKSTRITLDTSFEELNLEIGDRMQVLAVIERKEDVLWLPPQAIRKFENRRFVVVQDGDVQRRVDVTIGVESEDRVEIEEGLTEGQIVMAP